MTTPPDGPTPTGGSAHIREEPPNAAGTFTRRLLRPAQVIIVSSVMFSFISYWRTAAVVLCDLASTSYYIGGIVEQSIGSAAPWFILGVMCFSYAVRSVYIESCTLFVRGGVYRVVREALGKFMAKLAVSSLMFDYILTGPISAVSGGQYIIGLALEIIAHWFRIEIDPHTRDFAKRFGSVLIATAATVYFFRKNIVGIHESSDKALKIMVLTTIMGVLMLTWCGVTLAVNGPAQSDGVPNTVSPTPDFHPKLNPTTKEMEDPTGFLKHTSVAEKLRELTGKPGVDWLGLIGVFGIFIAFGHSILAMSGEETLAQVYREVESPKLKNFKKAAFIVFVYSLILTGGISFLAVLLIPADVRMHNYSDNLIGGLAMNVIGPLWAKLLLNGFVVVVGALILSGAVNTAIIGSNGVLNRVAEDGVMPEWFLRPHPRYGTTYRILWLIFGLQIFTIWASFGDVLLLGEAYAFGVVWSFVFQALSMVVLRFKDPRPREAKVPLNLRVGKYEVPIGLIIILVILLVSAICNLLTKEVATIGGLSFTVVFFTMFYVSERYHDKLRRGKEHEHMEQFNQETTGEVTAGSLGLTKMYRKLVSIRSPHNLFMLEKALTEADPETTSIVVMTAKLIPPGGSADEQPDLDTYDQQLMTAVVTLAERAGKQVKPLIVPTNNPIHAVLNTAKDLQAHELIMGASNRYTADEQMEQIAFYWISLHGGNPAPLTVRILSRERDIYLDLAGGNRIPKISERKARSVAELRAAGVGVDRVLLIHDGSPANSDLFQGVLTMLDPQVVLGVVPVVPPGSEPLNGHGIVHQDEERARQLGRDLQVLQLPVTDGQAIVDRASREQYDLIILPLSDEAPNNPLGALDERSSYILRHAHCRVFLAANPVIPQEVVDKTPSSAP
ncbi:MAG TPA: APC family permease [Gemmataceae bacterium]|jgi:amino acid transporter/nucleotide-binding universal stress UspA family protein